MGRDLSGVLDAVLAGIVVVDTAGCIDLMNSAACRILEVSAETLAGQPIERLLGDRHPAATLVHKVLATGCATIQYELPIEHRARRTGEVHIVRAGLAKACLRSGIELWRFRRSVRNPEFRIRGGASAHAAKR